MGIKSLLRSVRDVEEPVHISQLKDCRVGIDAYCWIHRAICSCSIELATGAKTSKHIQYILNRTQGLLREGCKPIFVFDGADLPSKKETNESRSRARASNLHTGLNHYAAGDYGTAYTYFIKGLDVTSEMAYEVIQALRSLAVECIVAPYEADAQLAYMANNGYVDVVITEDSDLLVYGTPRVWFKMDREGNAVQLRHSVVRKRLANEVNCDDFALVQFQSMCILSGCDYLPSLPGVGLKKALKMVSSFGNIEEITGSLLNEKKPKVTQEGAEKYAVEFERALYCFTHHIVFDPVKRMLLNFADLIDKPFDSSIIGELHGPEIALQVCFHISIDPRTLLPYKTGGKPVKQSQITEFVSVRTHNARDVGTFQDASDANSTEPLPDISSHNASPQSNDSSGAETLKKQPQEPPVRIVSRFFANRVQITTNHTSDRTPDSKRARVQDNISEITVSDRSVIIVDESESSPQKMSDRTELRSSPRSSMKSLLNDPELTELPRAIHTRDDVQHDEDSPVWRDVRNPTGMSTRQGRRRGKVKARSYRGRSLGTRLATRDVQETFDRIQPYRSQPDGFRTPLVLDSSTIEIFLQEGKYLESS